MSETEKRQKVVIVGGGFGGVYAARSLLRYGFDVTLVSKTNFFIFTPLLHEVATGALSSDDIIFEFSSFFHHPRFTFYRETVESFDPKKQIVVTRDGEEIPYDFVIFATGSETNYFGARGEEHTLELKSIEDALSIKEHVVELAQGVERHLSINVVGGGPTGVELIFELKEFLETIKHRSRRLSYTLRLINAGETLCPQFPPTIQAYIKKRLHKEEIKFSEKTMVTEVFEDGVVTKRGEKIPGDVTIWTAGVRANTPYVPAEFKDARGNVRVDECLKIEGLSREYAVGDVIVRDGIRVPKLAQTALAQGETAAYNIDAHVKGKACKTYEPKLKGQLISLGKGKAAGTPFGVTISGVFAWLLWKAAYWVKIPGLRNKLEVGMTWLLSLFTSRRLFEK